MIEFTSYVHVHVSQNGTLSHHTAPYTHYPLPSPPLPSLRLLSLPLPSPLLTFTAGSHFLQEVPWGWRYHPTQCHGDLTVVLATTSVHSAMTPCPRNPLPIPSHPHFWSPTTVSLPAQQVSSRRSFTRCLNSSMFPWRGMTQSGI